ncbi:hypothetical protein CS022_10755 [Veronia nyctiphanis]|uniref:RDD domain-containing protein n=1 Tax=Veronia nyctiphanis TaxID=1278244 RepID=A0A4Q0YQ45_9GAMM|nr:RDD family protein [Veronia nyctiphanis]RXJ73217.1 hypothetical protein CS022_10755 [Veronia nyctiphanis]
MMPTPNYANYSLDELLDAKNNIDGEEYPDRLKALEQAIEARLENTEVVEKELAELDRAKFKNFWRRFFALILDVILLSLVTWVISAIMLPGALSSQPDISPPATLSQESVLEFQQKVEAASLSQQKLMSEYWIVLSVQYLINALIPLLYFILMHHKFGQTLGKMALNVIVVDLKTEKKISMTQSIRRSSIDIFSGFIFVTTSLVALVNIDVQRPMDSLLLDSPVWQSFHIGISILLLGLYIAKYLLPLFNRKRRGLHDYIAGTVVVRAE